MSLFARAVLIALLCLSVPGRAPAFSEAEVEQAALAAARGKLRKIVKRLAADAYLGRSTGTPESEAVQGYLVRQLRRLGQGAMSGGAGDDAYVQRFAPFFGGTAANLLAVIPGRELAHEAVVVGAHYDHLFCGARAVPDTICNGATDNAAGVAAVLAIGKALNRLPVPPRRSVVLALWDAEESGLLGSDHYVAQPAVPLGATVAYVNFDIQGSTLLPSLASVSFAIGAETGGSLLQGVVDDAVAAQTLDTKQLGYTYGQERSDYASFARAGVPSVFFSDATGGCYHTVDDERSIVDYRKLTQQSRTGFRVVLDLAERDDRPPFSPPSFPSAVYAEALVIDELLTRGLADAALFSVADQALLSSLQASVAGRVAAGPASFDEIGLLLDTLSAVGLLTRAPCARFR